MNLNKLFARLSIRHKLAIAFAGIALVPLVVVATATIQVTVVRLRDLAYATLRHDLDTARDEAERAIAETERDVGYIAAAFVEPALGGPARTFPAAAIAAFLGQATALFRLKVLAPDGTVLAVIQAPGEASRLSAPGEGEGLYYSLRAAELARGQRLVLPVEIRVDGAGGVPAPLPALAVVAPVHDEAGALRAVVVGEARAATLFEGLDRASPQFAGVTMLSDAEQNVLYDSERKRDWSSLLAAGESARGGGGKRDPSDAGARFTAGDEIVMSLPLRLGGAGSPQLTLLRAVRLATVNAPVRGFLLGVAVTGVLVLGLVLSLALVAARQLTGPLLRLREATGRLARNEEAPALQIETNDEIEDLARDFTTMASVLTRHRQELEAMVAERTRALQQTHAELRGILAHSADAIIALDPHGKIRVWNHGAERLFGYPAEEAIGREADALLMPNAAETERAFLRRELEAHGAVVNLPTRRRARDGRLVPVSLTQTVIRDASGSPVGMSLILRDTSLQTRLEDQLRRSERLAAVSVLAAGLAHEIHNPLAIISNRLECMEGELGDDRGRLRHDLQVLREHAGRLREVTGNLLRFARDSDQTVGPVDLLALMRRLVALLERALVGRQVVVRVLGEALVPPVRGNEAALETVALNLLLNAADAMPGGGAITVEVRGAADSRAVHLVVRDQGAGVPEALRERVFEPFFTTKADGHGTGLGLAVCRSIVERLGGRIWVEAEVPRGSRFIVALPPAPEEAA